MGGSRRGISSPSTLRMKGKHFFISWTSHGTFLRAKKFLLGIPQRGVREVLRQILRTVLCQGAKVMGLSLCKAGRRLLVSVAAVAGVKVVVGTEPPFTVRTWYSWFQ